MCECVSVCGMMYLNIFVQGKVSLMGEINDAKEREGMIDGEF